MELNKETALYFVLGVILFATSQSSGFSGESGMSVTPAKYTCEASAHGFCAFYLPSVKYNFVFTNGTKIINSIRTIFGNKSSKCLQFFYFSVCFYSFRECDPTDNSQLFICYKYCPSLTKLYQECVNTTSVKSLMSQAVLANNEEALIFFSYVSNFSCLLPETYVISDIPLSETFCSNADFINSLIKEEENRKSNGLNVFGLALGIPLLSVAFMIMAVSLCVVGYRLKKSKHHLRIQQQISERVLNDYRMKMETSLNSEVVEDIRLSAQEQYYYEERFYNAVIAFKNLKISATVGEGAFGVVCKGVLLAASNPPVQVAVKMAKNLSSKQEVHSLLTESLLMKRFDHVNVVGLLGVCFDTPDGYPYLILPFMINGNVRDYLKEKRVHLSNTDTLPKDLTVKSLMTMCWDISKGMEYLATHKFVHRDLAARNCMLDASYRVKVGDFGLARDVYAHLYYRASQHCRIPVKWSAPEMLIDCVCTEKSDVWSFGVTCWEVFSLGSAPYPGIDNCDIVDYVTSEQRLKSPHLCPKDMYAIMLSCWHQKPEERPNFKHLVANIHYLID